MKCFLFTARKRNLGQGNIFTPVCHSVHRGGVRGCSRGACMVALGGPCMVTLGGRAWLLQGVACVVAPEGMHGCSRGACMVAPGGACMVAPRGHVWLLPGGCAWLLLGGCAWDTMRYGDTINERAVRILLECILVLSCKRNHRRQTILQRSTLLFTITQYSCYRFCCNVTAFGLEQKAASCRFSILPQVL